MTSGERRVEPFMTTPDPIVSRELPVIHRIIQDETWLEGERRGCHVSADDPVVREKVCEVILRVGQQLRDSIVNAEGGGAGSRQTA